MAPSAHDRRSPTHPDDRYRLTPVAQAEGQCLPLTGRYVELVWSELLGPTATLVARRIGHALDRPDRGFDLSLVDLGDSLGVAPSKVRWSLTRLAYFELVTVALDPPAVLTSGLVTAVPLGLLPGSVLLGSSSTANCSGQRARAWPAWGRSALGVGRCAGSTAGRCEAPPGPVAA